MNKSNHGAKNKVDARKIKEITKSYGTPETTKPIPEKYQKPKINSGVQESEEIGRQITRIMELERQYKLHPWMGDEKLDYNQIRCERLEHLMRMIRRNVRNHLRKGDRSDRWVGARIRWREIISDAYYDTPGHLVLWDEDFGI